MTHPPSPSTQNPLTEKQVVGWREAIARLTECGATVPWDIANWDVIYAEETRPGRGHFINATFLDGEVFAQVLMDVYGYPTVSFATLDWVHADSNEECDCEVCEREREDDEEFCPDCFAGLGSSEHHAECIAPLDQIEGDA